MSSYREEPELRRQLPNKFGVYTDTGTGQIIVVKPTKTGEAVALSKLNHPHVVQFIRSFENDGQLCIVLAYEEHVNFRRYLQTAILNEEKIARIIYQLLSAVSHIHEQNIIHRDIKP